MRSVWLGLALLPYLATAGADLWIHERGRRVRPPEQWVHGVLALAMALFLAGVFLERAAVALGALGGFIAFLLWDEFAFHRGIARRERQVHVASWVALAGFLALWWLVDAR